MGVEPLSSYMELGEEICGSNCFLNRSSNNPVFSAIFIPTDTANSWIFWRFCGKNKASFWLSLLLAKNSAFLHQLSQLPFFLVLLQIWCYYSISCLYPYTVIPLVSVSWIFGERKKSPCVQSATLFGNERNLDLNYLKLNNILITILRGTFC